MIFYVHFPPAYKGGGPIQSLANLVKLLERDYRIFVICSARDLGDRQLMMDVKSDCWCKYSENVSVFYASGFGHAAVRYALRNHNPEFVYINGMFSPVFSIYSLWLAKKLKLKVVIAPRGMLQKGALAIKSLKKKLFLSLFKLFGLYKSVIWHATDKQEQSDIVKLFGATSVIRLAANIPKTPVKVISLREKNKKELRLVYLSLITEKKNLIMVLEALKDIKTPIQFDIFGPVKDLVYWQKCVSLMTNQVHSIQYKGTIKPHEVQSVLSTYHVFVLPTKGENFGHAIHEAFSVGTPAIISPYTPWGKLQDIQAGITIELNIHSLILAIEQFINYDQDQFHVLSLGAHKAAWRYVNQHDNEKQYKELFKEADPDF